MVMRPILIDTNAYAAFKKGNQAIIEIFQYADILAITPIVLGELLAGFEGGTRTKQNRIELKQFLQSARIKNFPITSETAHYFSQIYASLKLKGKPIPTNDMWIAAQALEFGCIVCTLDKHFQQIEGLLLANSILDLPL
jgi:tRNA(fMet)-specific endonuclease VapC